MPVNLSSVSHVHSPPPSSSTPGWGENTAPNAIIDIRRGNSAGRAGPEGRESGHSCYVNAAGDRGR